MKCTITSDCNVRNFNFINKPKILQYKGALLVLTWTVTVYSVLLYPGYAVHNDFIYYFATCMVTLPIAGWLADVYLGQYRVIRYSLWLLCASLVTYNALLVNEEYISKILADTVRVVTGSALAIGFSGVAANTVQFGLDQLTDSSSSDLSSYISWITWSFYLSNLVMSMSQSCTCKLYNHRTTFILFPLLCSISIASDFLWNHWLVKEPMTNNPIKLIFQVLRYAVKNKYPHLRSAFTYWEDKPYSRIDLGKAKYGGPFTTEQVEDVKTFFRILATVVPASLFVLMIVLLGQSVNNMMYHFKDDNDFIKGCDDTTVYMEKCFNRKMVEYFGHLAIVLLVPVLKCISCSKILRYKCFPYMAIFHKFLLGLLLLLMYVVLLLALEVTGIALTQNHNVTCVLNAEASDLANNQVLDLSYKWLILPQFVSGTANYILFKSGVEFVCAQSPKSMRGLLLGAMYNACFITLPIERLILKQISKTTGNNKYCGVWYYTILIAVVLVFIGSFLLLKKFYSYRRRDENVHNEQMFAVNYYDKYLQYKTNAVTLK